MPAILFYINRIRGITTRYNRRNYNVIYRRATLDIKDILNDKILEGVIVEDIPPKHLDLEKLEDAIREYPPDRHFYIGFLLVKKEDGKRIAKLIPYKGKFKDISKDFFHKGFERISKELSKINSWAIHYGLCQRKYEGPNFYIIILENPFIKIVLRIPFLTEGFYLAKIYLPGKKSWEFKEEILAEHLPLGEIKNKYYEDLIKSIKNRYLAFIVPLYGYIR